MLSLVIAWTCVGVFIATSALAVLSIANVIKLADDRYRNRLFVALIVQVLTIGVAAFSKQIDFSIEAAKQRAVDERYEAMIGEIDDATKNLRSIFKDTSVADSVNELAPKVKSKAEDLGSALKAALDNSDRCFSTLALPQRKQIAIALYYRGLAQSAMQELPDAYSSFVLAQRLDATSIEYSIRAGDLARLMKDYEHAAMHYQQAKGLLDIRSSGQIDEKFAVFRGLTNTERRLGAFMLNSNPKAARLRLDTALTYATTLRNIGGIDLKRKRIAITSQYAIHWESKDYDKAIAVIDDAIKSDPGYARYYEDKAAVMLDVGKRSTGPDSTKYAQRVVNTLLDLRTRKLTGVNDAFIDGTLGEALSLIPDAPVESLTTVAQSLQLEMSKEQTNKDPYLRFVLARIDYKLKYTQKAVDMISEAIALEEARESDVYTFDQDRLFEYKAFLASLRSDSTMQANKQITDNGRVRDTIIFKESSAIKIDDK